MKQPTTMPAWPREDRYERLEKCRVMLSVHAFLTDSENERVRSRIMRAAMRAQVKAQVARRGKTYKCQGCNYRIAEPGLCGECACEDDGV